MLGFSRNEILALLERTKIGESQKNAIADIIYVNNQRIEKDLASIIDQILVERERDLINNCFH
ncbi:hypothetical protein ACIQZG_15885 [Lysinibacillus sp. NPDC096418]|uniref:hypothetical protein n=1 Tax=Lysinibacillus sp. NPDC096418 TaxID=3364138 RepID=UPI00381AB0B7